MVDERPRLKKPPPFCAVCVCANAYPPKNSKVLDITHSCISSVFRTPGMEANLAQHQHAAGWGVRASSDLPPEFRIQISELIFFKIPLMAFEFPVHPSFRVKAAEVHHSTGVLTSMQEDVSLLHYPLLLLARGVICRRLLAVTQPFSGSGAAACCLLALLPGGKLSASLLPLHQDAK